MTEKELKAFFSTIEPLSEQWKESAQIRLDKLAKPPRSLGRLEEIAIQLAGIQRTMQIATDKKAILIMSADNGVVEEGVASAPQAVTLAQTINFTRNLTGVGALAKNFGVDLKIYDVGINAPFHHEKVIDRKIRYGTYNIAKQAAMSREEAVQAISIGIEAAQSATKEGYNILGVGEMGIGNTTTSTAILAVLTGLEIDQITGRGGCITTPMLENKKKVIRQALAVNQPNPADAIDIVAKVGGFDIAAMVGAFLGAASCKIPVVIDGYISAVAALVASRLCKTATQYMIPSHASIEPGYQCAMEEMGIEPLFLLGMRLGEGSGCPLTFEVTKAACAIFRDMATFEEAEINDEYLEEIRKEL